MNAKTRPANIRQVAKEMDGVSNRFVRDLINSELSNHIDCPIALAYLNYLGILCIRLEVIMYGKWIERTKQDPTAPG